MAKDIIEAIINSGKSLDSVVPLNHSDCRRIIDEYTGTKDAWKKQAKFTLELRQALEKLKNSMNDRDDLQAENQIVSQIEKLTKEILESESGVFDHVEELARATKILE